MRQQPTQNEEYRLSKRGFRLVAGIDEVGRGPLAGPVVAAAVVLPLIQKHDSVDISLIRDSKQMTPAQRQRAAAVIKDIALTIGVGVVSAKIIDRIGIVKATQQAMVRALNQLTREPDHLLVDALDLKWRDLDCTPIVHGDAICTAIAAASIIAKVYRDTLMVRLSHAYPGYGFAANKGYPSQAHRDALSLLGPCTIHRFSFAPLNSTNRRSRSLSGII